MPYTQKRIAEILRTRQRKEKHAGNRNSAQISSRSSSRCSGKSRKSMDFHFSSSTKGKAKRSRSLINLMGGFSSVSTCVNSINEKYQQTYKNHHTKFGQNETQTTPGCSDEEDAVSERTISLSTSLSHLTSSKSQESESRSKQYKKLSSAVKRLHLMLHDVQANTFPTCRTRSQSPTALLEKPQIPRPYEKNSILKLAGIVQTLTKSLHTQVSHFIVIRRKEKIRLEESRNDNTILKQRLNNSLTVQKNLEGELKELNKEKKLLEAENKNLAIKIAPFLTEDKKTLKTTKNKNERAKDSSANNDGLDDDDVRNNNYLTMESESSKNCYDSNSAKCSKSYFRCSRRSSMTGVSPRRWPIRDKYDTSFISQSVSDSNLTLDSSSEDVSKADEIIGRLRKIKSSHELDTIASYVRWKSQDFNRLHGNLHKSFKELQQLKQTISQLSREKSEILTDLEDLVDSYRELERERDNYESILKMILKEKNSPESDIRQLLDGLLLHLSNATQDSHHHRCQLHECDPNHHHCPNSRNFLESALQVVQEQNISIREEIKNLRETLHTTSGQNTVLQANNQALMEKVNDLQRQVESKESEANQKERESKERFEQLDKLYKTILSARDDLENRLQEKEKEIGRLNLKNVTDASDKAIKEQADKITELKEANSKLEKEVARFRASNEKLNQVVKQCKTELKEQKGKLSDQYKSTCNELQKSKEQCTWLQGQVDNFKVQLLDAHERIKLQEKDKSILAHKVLAAEEERKTLDRNIHEIRTIMEADKLYQQALSERNELLQSEVNRLRTEKLSGDSMHETSMGEQRSPSQNKSRDDGDGNGEKRNNSSFRGKTAATRAVKNKPKPSKSATPIGRQNVSRCLSDNVKQVCTGCHKCAACATVTSKATTTCTSAQRTAAAIRLSNGLSSSPRRPLRDHSPTVKAAASSGPQDSTLKSPRIVHRTAASSHSISNNKPKSSVLVSSGKRPLVALVRVKRRPLIIN